MSSKSRMFMLVLALVAALAMLMASVSFAAAQAPATPVVCVSGYVINHREQPVDGTKVIVGNNPAGDPIYGLTVMVEGSAAAGGLITVTETAPVGADGKYTFTNLQAGLYYNFKLQLPPEWDGIVPMAPLGSVAETGYVLLKEQGTKCYDVLFKIRRWFDVTVIKHEEARDGTVAPGVDWTITAYPQNDPWAVKATGKTGTTGRVVLKLTPGKWLIQETVKPGWTPVTPASVYITLDQYAPGGALSPVIFKNLAPVCYGTIPVEKYGHGIDAQGNPVPLGPLAGWHITLRRADGAMTPVTLATDGFGMVTFKNLKPGVYHVSETVQPGWEAMSDNPQQVIIDGNCKVVQPKVLPVVFDNREVVGKLQISGTKYFRAWVPPYQGKTVGISGWLITATLKGTNPPIALPPALTNALGNYLFSEADLKAAGMAIPGATITVCEEKRFHWIPVTPVCVDVKFPYPVPVTYKGAVVNFTNVQDPPLPGAGGGSSSTATCSVTYQVRPGDTLSGIAAANGTSASALAQRNGLANPNHIRAGQTLCIQ